MESLELLSRVMSPRRPQLAEALDAVGYANIEVNEALRALSLSPSSLSSIEALTSRLLTDSWLEGRCGSPLHVAQAVVMASDVRGVETAEALSLEVMSRLSTWGASQADSRRWLLAQPNYVSRLHSPIEPWSVVESVLSMARAQSDTIDEIYLRELRELSQYLPERDGWGFIFELAVRASMNSFLWDVIVFGGWTIPSRDGVPEVVRGVDFASLKDPFAPMVDIFALGYALVSVDGDELILLSPLVGL